MFAVRNSPPLKSFLLSVDPECPEALATALERLADDPVLRAEMGRNSRALAEREFSREKLTVKLEGVLQNAIDSFSRGS